MTREVAIVFVSQLQRARLAALADAEAFSGIIHVVERLGSYLSQKEFGVTGKNGGLHNYGDYFREFVTQSGLSVATDDQPYLLSASFSRLYKMVTIARNDAVHQGASARHLTVRSIELAILLEDVLSTYLDPVVGDFMVRNPICAETWQSVGFTRQQMLANSYSYLPILCPDRVWRVISDAAIAKFVGPERNGRLVSNVWPLRFGLQIFHWWTPNLWMKIHHSRML